MIRYDNVSQICFCDKREQFFEVLAVTELEPILEHEKEYMY